MSPILGIYASSISPSLNANSYSSIATVTVGAGGQSTVTFSSIPSTYKHLQLRYIWQASANDKNLNLTFNSDSGSNYAFHWLYGNGTSALAYAQSTQTAIQTAYNYAATGTFTTADYVAGVTDILDYASTSKNKTVRTLFGVDYNGGGGVHLDSGLWQNSSTAISSISLVINGGGNIQQYSQFALYGIK